MDRLSSTDAEYASRQQKAFELAEQAARRVIRRRFRVIRLTRDAYTKLSRHEGALSRVARDLRSLVRLARAWASREYRDVPWRSVVFVVAAIIYFVNPVDLIPDLLTGIGFVDDTAVVSAVVRSIADDLAAFRDWEHEADLKPAPKSATLRTLHGPTPAAA